MTANTETRKPDEFDIQVGARVRERRRQLGITQAQLGEASGLTFQQIQKYELGANRISCSKLNLIAKKLQVPMSALLGEDLTDEERGQITDALRLSALALTIARGVDQIETMAHRRAVLDLVKALAGEVQGQTDAMAA